MAKSSNTWQKKLMAKDARLASRARYGSMVPLLTRNKSPFHEKKLAFEDHRKMIVEHGVNPTAVFDGTGLPDEVTKQPKTNQERAEADKRNPLRAEWSDGFKPRGFGKKIAAREARGFNAA